MVCNKCTQKDLVLKAKTVFFPKWLSPVHLVRIAVIIFSQNVNMSAESWSSYFTKDDLMVVAKGEEEEKGEDKI